MLMHILVYDNQRQCHYLAGRHIVCHIYIGRYYLELSYSDNVSGDIQKVSVGIILKPQK